MIQVVLSDSGVCALAIQVSVCVGDSGVYCQLVSFVVGDPGASQVSFTIIQRWLRYMPFELIVVDPGV